MQILRSCRCNLRSPSTDRRSDHGPVLVVRGSPLQPLPSQLRKLVKSRLTDRPTSVDQTTVRGSRPPYPASDMSYG
ncbi:hypothetical protein MTR67_024151 [Solanum verrucosum]|uniref:Uncharacterized protein n=1 Tax=Solanum verrucosum TaxID=315347 RepID=A0AAF0QWH8_SOLVR|nr:hypothetical protein MTR67_024151 [Solanum verrucosum]